MSAASSSARSTAQHIDRLYRINALVTFLQLGGEAAVTEDAKIVASRSVL
jgi:hypothetical protein